MKNKKQFYATKLLARSAAADVSHTSLSLVASFSAMGDNNRFFSPQHSHVRTVHDTAAITADPGQFNDSFYNNTSDDCTIPAYVLSHFPAHILRTLFLILSLGYSTSL